MEDDKTLTKTFPHQISMVREAKLSMSGNTANSRCQLNTNTLLRNTGYCIFIITT